MKIENQFFENDAVAEREVIGGADFDECGTCAHQVHCYEGVHLLKTASKKVAGGASILAIVV